MFFPLEDALAIDRAEPGSGISLRKRELVRDLQFLKCAIAFVFVIADPTTVRIQPNPNNREGCKSPSRSSNSARRLQIESVKGEFICSEQSPCFQREKRRDRRTTERHQERDEPVNATNSQETPQKHERADNFLRPRDRVVFFDRVRFRNEKRRFPETKIQGIIWTYADTIHAFHAAGIDYHSVLFHFRVDENVRRACGSAVPTLIAGVGHANFSRRKLVGETEKSAVRTGVGAKTLLSQKVNGHESADEKKWDSDCDGRKCCPKIGGNEMVGEFRDKRSVLRAGKEFIGCGPDEHIQSADKWDIDQQPRSKRLGGEANFL